VEPETDISKYAIGTEWDKMGGPGSRAMDGSKIAGEAKFFQLVRPNPEEPCPTVTATAGSTGAASVVHPTEKRKFSVGELRRLCAFPDDFILTGTYSQQVERLGRAVMPPVTAALGRAIAEKILKKTRHEIPSDLRFFA
jgi:DNA (cytosine-5)-methyltransferase 1